jgi:hypothetical protein
LVTEDGGGLSVRRQCELLGLPRSSFYYTPVPESEEDLCWIRQPWTVIPGRHSSETRRTGGSTTTRSVAASPHPR